MADLIILRDQISTFYACDINLVTLRGLTNTDHPLYKGELRGTLSWVVPE